MLICRHQPGPLLGGMMLATTNNGSSRRSKTTSIVATTRFKAPRAAGQRREAGLHRQRAVLAPHFDHVADRQHRNRHDADRSAADRPDTGFNFAQNKSTAQREGLQRQRRYGLATPSAGTSNFDTVADSRGVTSASTTRSASCPAPPKPRMADDRGVIPHRGQGLLSLEGSDRFASSTAGTFRG